MSDNLAHEIITTLSGGRNINSAIKAFLKREVQRGDVAEKFTKRLRSLFAANNSQMLEAYVAKQLPEYERHFLVLARYAHADAVDAVSSAVIDTYAEDFNLSYEKNDDGIDIKEPEKFEEIVRKVGDLIDRAIAEHGLPDTSFMRQTLLNWIFDPEVMVAVAPLLSLPMTTAQDAE